MYKQQGCNHPNYPFYLLSTFDQLAFVANRVIHEITQDLSTFHTILKWGTRKYRYLYLICLNFVLFPAYVCAEEIHIRTVGELTYITHVDKYESSEEARASCYAFLDSINPPIEPYCTSTIWTRKGREPLISSANNKEGDSYTWHALFYFYPKYFLAPVFEPTQCPKPKEGNPCSPFTGIKTQTETDYESANGTLRVLRYYTSHSLEGNYSPLYSYSDWGFDDGVSDLGPRWEHNYALQMDGEGELDYKYYPGVKSKKYSTPAFACEIGWNEIRNNYPLLSGVTALYRNGMCEISQDQIILARLIIHNTLFPRKDVATSTQIRTFNRANGDAITFLYDGNQWEPLKPTQVSLDQIGANWRLTSSGGTVETYNSDGKLISIKSSTGEITSFTYGEEGRLATVTGYFGDMLAYHYDESGHLTSITTPDGNLNYDYDSNGRLVSVDYPDNTQRQYHYENTSFPYHLTGITDENNQRYATWAYDEKGRAILSEHAGGAEQVEFAYNSDGTTTVTDAKGAERTYNFEVKQSTMRITHIEGDRCATCPNGGIKAYTYDSNGFIASKTDWNGIVTTYTRDAQGRELSRTEASSTPEARTITTTWDIMLNKPLTITDSKQITEYSYDSDGRLLSKKQRAIQ